MQPYGVYLVEGLMAKSYNHKPLCMTCQSHSPQKRLPVFIYETSWKVEDECCQQVKQLWHHGPKNNNAVSCIQQKLHNCAKGLKYWGANKNKGNMAAIEEL